MKLVKTKLSAALVLAGLMFGLFSFSTTRIAAQNTASKASATTPDDEKKLVAQLAEALTRFFHVSTMRSASPPDNLVQQYPTDALD